MAPFSKRKIFRKIFRRELPNLYEAGSEGESSLSCPSTLYKNQPPTITQDSQSQLVTLASQDQVIRNNLKEDVSDARPSLGNIGLQLFSTGHLSQDKVKVIKSKLEDATTRLNSTIIEHERRNKNQKVEFTTEGMINAMQEAGTSPQSGIVFGEYIERVVTKQRFLRDETTRGKLTHYAAKLYPVTRMVLGIVSFSADAASFSPVKIAANGLQLVLSAAMDVHEQGEDIIQQLEALNDYGPFLENLRELDNSSQLVERACEFLIATTNFLNTSLEYLDKSALRKAISESWVMSKESFESARKRLDEQVERDMQIELFKWINQNKDDRILSSISMDTSYREKQQQYSVWRMPNIGQWVLGNENFREWEKEQPTNSARVLCCTGLPGAGKTFIASQIVTHLEERRLRYTFQNPNDKIGIAYIYCSIADEGQQTAIGFISSIARQLTELPFPRPNPLMNNAKSFYDGYSYQGRIPGLSEYKSLIRSLLHHLDHTFIVVDALDECIEYDENHMSVRDTFVKTLLSFNVHLLFTSRHVGAVDYLKEEAARLGAYFKEIEISPLPDDVKSYIDWRIYDEQHGNTCLQRWIENGNISRDEIINGILDKYCGIFNLVRLQMNEIQQYLSPGDVREALRQPGKTEEQFYDEAMDRINSSDNIGIRRRLGFRTLGWVLRAKRPLHFKEIQDALAMSGFMGAKSPRTRSRDEFSIREQDMLTACHGLVIIESKTRLVALAHATVKEYLVSTGCARIPFDIDVDLAEICLSYISDDVFSKGACKDDDSFAIRVDKNPFYSYAAQYWGEHVRGRIELALKDHILDFLGAEGLLLSAVQAKTIMDNNYRFNGRSQTYAKNINDLWFASQLGLRDIATALIEEKADVNICDDKGRTALAMAVMGGHEEIVRLLIDRGSDISAQDKDKRTVLHYAIAPDRLGVIEILITEANVEINARDGDGSTPLHYAAEAGLEDVVEKLLDHNADPKLKSKWGWTPLDSAAPSGYQGIATKLLDHGADADSTDQEGYTALYWTAPGEYKDTVELLLNRGAKPDLGNRNGVTPLHATAYNGVEEIMKLLLDKATEINPQDNSQWTPLHAAALNGRDDMVRLLLERGAEAGVVDEDGWTPLEVACWMDHEPVKQILIEKTDGGDEIVERVKRDKKYKSLEVWRKQQAEEKGGYELAATRALDLISRGRIDKVQALLSDGLDVNGYQRGNMTPLSVAVGWHQKEICRLLLDNGADVNKPGGRNDRTALHIASYYGDCDIVRMLLEAGADINAIDTLGNTPLSLAVDYRERNTAEILIEKGADLNIGTHSGFVPLLLAIYSGDEELVRMLLKKGADTERPDNDGFTPLLTAIHQRKYEITKLLLEEGANVNAASTDGTLAFELAINRGCHEICCLLRPGYEFEVGGDDYKSGFESEGSGSGPEEEDEEDIVLVSRE